MSSDPAEAFAEASEAIRRAFRAINRLPSDEDKEHLISAQMALNEASEHLLDWKRAKTREAWQWLTPEQ